VIYYALVAFCIALISGAMAVVGNAALPSEVSWLLSLVGTVLFVIHLVTVRRRAT
jgi:uncharacterized membrane protein YtjA (UPF0391 family)